MCLCSSLQGAKYQHCFRELANLFCKEEMDRGPVFRAQARRRKKKKKSSNLPVSKDISEYIILAERHETYPQWISGWPAWTALPQLHSRSVDSPAAFNFGEKRCICFPIALHSCFTFSH